MFNEDLGYIVIQETGDVGKQLLCNLKIQEDVIS